MTNEPTGNEPESTGCNNSKMRQPGEDESDINAPQKTHGRCTNYHFLNNPFPDEEEEEGNIVEGWTMSMVRMQSGEDVPNSLKDTK